MRNKVLWTIGGIAALVLILTVVALVAPRPMGDNGALVNETGSGRAGYGRDGNMVALDESGKTKYSAPGESTSIAIPSPMPEAKGMTASGGAAQTPDDVLIAKPLPPLFGQMMKKDGNIAIEAEKPKEASDAVVKIATKLGGDVLSMHSSGDTENMYFDITIRIPVNNFENALTELTKLGKVQDVQTNSEDVTSQYVDLKARLSSREALKSRLMLLLSKTDKIGELLQIQDRVSSVEQEIESIKGEMKYLEGMSAYSRINVRISGKGNIISDGGDSPFVEGLKRVWEAIQQAVLWIMLFFGVSIPILAVILLLVWLGMLIYRKNTKKA